MESLDARQWNGTTIQRRSIDGFVNATAMCKAGGKRWHDYVRYDRSQEYIASLEAAMRSTGNPADLITTIATGPNEQRGTWIHPRLAVDLARWISPAFAVWMDGWFLEAAQAQLPEPSPPASQLRPLPAANPIGVSMADPAINISQEVDALVELLDHDLGVLAGAIDVSHAGRAIGMELQAGMFRVQRLARALVALG